MRGRPKRQTARVLIIQHNTQHTRQRWPALTGVHSIHATLWRLGLNYSSESRGENAKHIFEYLYAFVWVHWNNKIVFIVVCMWVWCGETCRYQILHSDPRCGVTWGATRLCLGKLLSFSFFCINIPCLQIGTASPPCLHNHCRDLAQRYTLFLLVTL